MTTAPPFPAPDATFTEQVLIGKGISAQWVTAVYYKMYC